MAAIVMHAKNSVKSFILKQVTISDELPKYIMQFLVTPLVNT